MPECFGIMRASRRDEVMDALESILPEYNLINAMFHEGGFAPDSVEIHIIARKKEIGDADQNGDAEGV